MEVIQDSVVIAAGARNDDVLSAKRNALIPVTARRGARVRISMTASATGLYVECYSGQFNILERSLASAQNRVPIIPDDVVIQATGGVPTTRITMPADNPTGGNITLFYRIEVQANPVGRAA